MKDIITNKIYEVYNDFLIDLSKAKKFCSLKGLRFDADNIPDYNDPILRLQKL
jgi:hypothetical protein